MDLLPLIVGLTAMVISVSFHELAHGWAAERFGDPTAREAGRITLNPIKHIDPMWSVVIPGLLLVTAGVAFGGAKPVPYNPNRFRKGTNMRLAHSAVAAAGPLINFILALVSILIMEIYQQTMGVGSSAHLVYRFFSFSFMINILLGLFNLIPIPPLDGGKILAQMMPKSFQPFFNTLERFALVGIIVVFALIYFTQLGAILVNALAVTQDGFSKLAKLILSPIFG